MTPKEVPSFDVEAVGTAAHSLVRAIGRRPLVTAPTHPENHSRLSRYVAGLAAEAGLTAEAVDFFGNDVDRLLDRRVPFVFVPAPANGRCYAVVGRVGRAVTVLGPAGEQARAPTAQVLGELTHSASSRFSSVAERLRARVPALEHQSRLAQTLATEFGSSARVGWGFVFRPNQVESLADLTRAISWPGLAVRLLLLSLLQSALTVGSWSLIGSLSLRGHAEPTDVVGWALVATCAVLVQAFTVHLVGRFTIRGATLVRQRLLEGAVALDFDGLSHLGFGGLMVVAQQADALLEGVLSLFLAALAVVTNLVAAVIVLSATPVATLYVLALGLAVLVVAAAAPTLFALQRAHHPLRMGLTTDLVERMLGHRTRLVQQTPSAWHDGEDEALLGYAEHSKRLDRVVAWLRAFPRMYYAASLSGVFVVLVAYPTSETLALSLGGLTLGSLTLAALVEVAISGASLSALWQAIGPLVRTEQPAVVRAPAFSEADLSAATPERGPLVELRGVGFRYPGRAKPVFDGVDLRLEPGARTLIEGPSGGGKTTLAALLAGLRKPTSGLVLLGGLDQHTIGEGYLRRLVALAPQFYKNHVFTSSLAFNVLLGRAWPPSREDVAEAEQVCLELGLGDLLSRMPGGLYQNVGEAGWQLSHGEKSRAFLARTLLQGARLVVLDESFGALDPDSLQKCMNVVLARSESLVVITHR